MTILEFLLLLLIAGLVGGLAKSLTGYTHGGCIVAIVLGFVGALLGTWMAAALALPEPFVVRIGDRPFPILWSIIGASLFVALLSLLTRRNIQQVR